ncbi:MAG: type II secretion system F family protein [Candidatus Omnitrophica bacterium]|nr:type II secretion system F family protein [Candidatus Omnitrophota bacterium]
MAIYIYKAVDNQGKTIKGELEADSEMDLTSQLTKSGYLPVSIDLKSRAEESRISFIENILKKTQKADPAGIVIFTRQFSTIIKAAIPIVEGLGVLAEQTEDPALKKALYQITRDVEGGMSLSQSMSRHPGVFSDLYVNTVLAGESAGVLDKVLMRLSQMLEDDYETRKNIMSALQYPAMVVVALIIAVVVLSVFVVPQFSRIYTDAKMSLPLPTQIMILISKILRGYWYAVLPAAGGIFLLFQWVINTPQGRIVWDTFKFKVPVFGKVYTKITMLRFASMLSVLYQAGLPVLKTLDIVGSTIGNKVLSIEIGKIKQDVAEGKGISGGVLNSKFFPRLVGYMISIGEKSGALSLMLDSLCEYFGLEVKSAMKNLTTMIEPIMTAVLGISVMGMALAIFLPLWSLIQVFKGGG